MTAKVLTIPSPVHDDLCASLRDRGVAYDGTLPGLLQAIETLQIAHRVQPHEGPVAIEVGCSKDGGNGRLVLERQDDGWLYIREGRRGS